MKMMSIYNGSKYLQWPLLGWIRVSMNEQHQTVGWCRRVVTSENTLHCIESHILAKYH